MMNGFQNLSADSPQLLTVALNLLAERLGLTRSVDSVDHKVSPRFMRSSRPPFPLKHFFIPLGCVGVATLLTMAIRPLFAGSVPLTFFVLAVVLAAAYGGLWMGFLATLLSLVVTGFLFEHAVILLAMSRSSLTLFAVLGFGISVILGLLHRANAQVARAKKQLELTNRQLSQQKEALARSNEELRRLAYALSHDLQAPLRQVASFADLFIRRNATTLDPESMNLAQWILSGVRRMESRIKGLLDYAAATVSEDSDIATSCEGVLAKVLEDLRSVIGTTGAVITFNTLPVVPINENRLIQVFSNLIGNAIKYRGARRPEIHISATEDGSEWRFSVKDNGIGIDMKYADEIFGLFTRLHSTEEYEGNGIGLAVCKAVIERQGGRIWVESDPGQGSTFYFTIPKNVSESFDSAILLKGTVTSKPESQSDLQHARPSGLKRGRDATMRSAASQHEIKHGSRLAE
jgi:signal transduction histidine kinase